MISLLLILWPPLTRNPWFVPSWKRHENSRELKRDNEDLVDILLKVYQDDKVEFKINRTHLKAFLLVSHSYFACVFIL